MKTLALLLLITVIASCKKAGQGPPPKKIDIGYVEKIHSEILDENRTVWVHLPEGGNGVEFPVLYLLDGDTHFRSVVGLMHQLSSVNGNRVLPKMIVVAILNTKRTRDLTPTGYIPRTADDTSAPETGGGDAFTRFIAEELIPLIEKKYPATKERTLVGHSLGGLMVVNTLVKHGQLFDKYLAIDPSLWWNNRQSLREYKEALSANSFEGKSLFISIANTISMDSLSALKDTTETTSGFRAIIDFVSSLKETSAHGLDWEAKYYPGESHGSVPLISEYDGFQFLYRKIPIAMSEVQLKHFEGKYSHQFRKGEDSFLQVVARKDHLSITESWRNIEMSFSPISERHFYCFSEKFPIRFNMTPEGEIFELIAFESDVWKKVE